MQLVITRRLKELNKFLPVVSISQGDFLQNIQAVILTKKTEKKPKYNLKYVNVKGSFTKAVNSLLLQI